MPSVLELLRKKDPVNGKFSVLVKVSFGAGRIMALALIHDGYIRGVTITPELN